jgi:hypothetical protein
MTINYQFGDVDAHGATIRARLQHWKPSIKPAFVMCSPRVISGAGTSSAACQELTPSRQRRRL